MQLVLIRVQQDPDITIGELMHEGHHLAWTCEDPVRFGPKIPGQTAIPAGTYQIRITYSNRFKRPLPLLLDVPGFEGIRIHPGNTTLDTEGCLLPGMDRLPNGVGRSRLAFETIYVLIEAAEARKEPVSIEII